MLKTLLKPLGIACLALTGLSWSLPSPVAAQGASSLLFATSPAFCQVPAASAPKVGAVVVRTVAGPPDRPGTVRTIDLNVAVTAAEPDAAYNVYLADLFFSDGVQVGCAANPVGSFSTRASGEGTFIGSIGLPFGQHQFLVILSPGTLGSVPAIASELITFDVPQ